MRLACKLGGHWQCPPSPTALAPRPSCTVGPAVAGDGSRGHWHPRLQASRINSRRCFRLQNPSASVLPKHMDTHANVIYIQFILSRVRTFFNTKNADGFWCRKLRRGLMRLACKSGGRWQCPPPQIAAAPSLSCAVGPTVAGDGRRGHWHQRLQASRINSRRSFQPQSLSAHVPRGAVFRHARRVYITMRGASHLINHRLVV